MPTPARRRSRIAQLEVPFIAIAATIALGCGGQTLRDDDDELAGAGEPASEEAPASAPPVAQTPPATACSGPTPFSSSCGFAVCINGRWESPAFNCTHGWATSNPPVPEPAPMPDAGTADAGAADAGPDNDSDASTRADAAL